MTVATAASTTATPTRAASRRRYIPYLFFTLCACLYFLPFMRVFMQDSVEGGILYRAVCVAHGQVFGRDFFEMIGPGSYYWLAVFFKLFGSTFLASRICLFLTSMGTALLMYSLSRRICRRYAILPCIFLFAAYFSVLWPAISPHNDSNFLALLAVAFMLIWLDSRRPALLLAAGFLAGVTTWFLLPKGVLMLGAFLVWLAWIEYTERSRWSASLSLLSMVTASYLSAIGLMLFYFWHRGVLKDFVYETFLWPFHHYSGVGTVPYGLGTLKYHWMNWGTSAHGIHWTSGISAVLVLPFLLAAILPFLMLILGLLHWREIARPEILLYWLCGWALWLSEIHRKDTFHLVYGSALLIILFVYLLEKHSGKVAVLSLQIVSISVVCLAAFNFFLVLTANTMSTRVGQVAMFRNDPVLGFLNHHVPPGSEMLAYPYCSQYYFLSDTINPTRYNGFLYGVTPPSVYQEVIRNLDQRKVQYVLWDTNFEKKGASKFFPELPHMPPQGFILEPYLESHYTILWEKAGIRVMERKDEDHSDLR